VIAIGCGRAAGRCRQRLAKAKKLTSPTSQSNANPAEAASNGPVPARLALAISQAVIAIAAPSIITASQTIVVLPAATTKENEPDRIWCPDAHASGRIIIDGDRHEISQIFATIAAVALKPRSPTIGADALTAARGAA
jgi:hypothetical protein